MRLFVVNSGAIYDIDGDPRMISDTVVGDILVGRRAAIPGPPSRDEAVKFIEDPKQLSVEAIIRILSSIRGVFIGEPSKLEEANKCWSLIRLSGKLIEKLEPTYSWCSCIGLTNSSIKRRVAFERMSTPETVLSGNVVVGLSLFNLPCKRIEFRDTPLLKFNKPQSPRSLIDIVAEMMNSRIGDVVINLEGIVEDIGEKLDDLAKAKLRSINDVLNKAVEGGIAYIELDKLADETFNDVCKELGHYILDIKKRATRMLMI
ncbi:MAG: hypothetical protein N3F04_00850 [Candidatus Nezhaarchaeota archaeon]|nr:hypothetical protein [Candidatus Nezhaarchaeota archaeon]MCX8141324.1 hypothetical protein [Candidatus Nezhaarchaeota archaeon]MDW8049590.1 hypothetical protein [Nitrososphaerota archaeon]